MHPDIYTLLREVGFSWMRCCAHCQNAIKSPANSNIKCAIIEKKMQEIPIYYGTNDYNRCFVEPTNTCQEFISNDACKTLY